MSKYEAVIGIEVHVQLKTNTKIFCACSNKFGDEPNTNICVVCTGQPGSLPVLNKKVVDYAILAGLATNCSINKISTFTRKHYIYPDLPKNIQITQVDLPICINGYVPIETETGGKRITLDRIHMEEDAGKSIHATTGESFIDLNRAGTPLLEIVSNPDISNSAEAKTYLARLRSIMIYLGISEANMEEGSFRADTNVSIRLRGTKELGTKVELKNINSFKFIGQAIEYELVRQEELLESGQRIAQETRLWDSKEQVSISMRSKEEAQDYRYFQEPDIPPLVIDDVWIERLKTSLPELPHHRVKRFETEYGIPYKEAEVLVNQPDIAAFFEESTKISKKPKQTANWILRDLLNYLNEHKISLSQTLLTSQLFAELILAIENGVINTKTAVDVFLELMKTGKSPGQIIQEKGLTQISSSEELEKIISSVIENNQDAVAKYRAGNEKLFMFFVGQVMKESKGKGNPQMVQDILKKKLG